MDDQPALPAPLEDEGAPAEWDVLEVEGDDRDIAESLRLHIGLGADDFVAAGGTDGGDSGGELRRECPLYRGG